MLTPNSPLPTFSVHDQDNQTVTQADLLGAWSVLYFYPRDETPGCTIQACSFRDANHELTAHGVKVFGISKDSAASHRKFRTNHQLPYTLLADTDHQMAEAFGVWVEKSMYGKKYMGMDRSTFIVRPDGTIAAAYPSVDPNGHASFILEELTKLKAS